MPRSLPWRIALAFGTLALAVLLSVGGALFVVLRTLHVDATNARLADLSGTLVAEVRSLGTGTTATEALALLRGQVADQNVSLYLLMASGRLISVEGSPPLPANAITVPASAIRDETERGTVRLGNGTEYLYAATVLRNPAAVGTRALVVATPDLSRADALRDLATALPVVLLALLLIGGPIAWLLSRSVTGPLRRLERATADPAAAAAAPLALTGPTEVQDLTARFNEMSAELAGTRRHERELLANLRHDLRTPLTVIAGFAAALTDGTARGEDAERAARAIGEEAARLERLVGELGAIDRLRAGAAGLRPETLDVDALLDETVERFTGRAEAQGVDLSVASPGATADGDPGASGTPRLALTADRLAVERILANLVDNALKSVGPGGHVWVAGRRWQMQIPGRQPVEAVVLSVTDDGPGFPPGAAERVFDRFYRADPSRPSGGSGLGLTIVRELARAHGGEATAENVAPHGARVSVVLPTVATSMVAVPAPRAPGDEAGPAQWRTASAPAGAPSGAASEHTSG